MAVTFDRKSIAPVEAPPPSLGSRLGEYTTLMRRDRRRRYLGLAATGVGLIWLVLSLLYYFDAGLDGALPMGLSLTVALPISALLIETLRRPTDLETAHMLDSLLDNRQRVVTSLELVSYGAVSGAGEAGVAQSPIENAQLTSTAGLLAGVAPRALYPARLPVAQLAVAAGLLVAALGLWLLKGANDDFALATGGLPPGQQAGSALSTPTALSGLPGSQNEPTGWLPSAPATQQPGDQPAGEGEGPTGQEGQGEAGAGGPPLSPEDAQQRAAASREAQKSLQRLARALDEQGFTQGIADLIRQGDYTGADDALVELGATNDQLSSEAKDALAASLDAAADDSASTPDLQGAERDAAQALRRGTFSEVKEALEQLGRAVKDAGRDVIPQDDLARSFPDQPQSSGPAPEGANPSGEPNPNSGQENQGSEGQPPANSGADQGASGDAQNGDAGEGPSQPAENGQGDSSSPSEGAQGSPSSNAQGAGGGAGLPGEGSRVDGPPGQDIDVAGNPFELESKENPDPNKIRPGDGKEPPAMTLEGGQGGSGSATGPSSGGPVDATGETAAPPVGRWGIVQRYFSHEPK